MPRTKPPYPAAFRQQILELTYAGRTPAELSREFNVTAQTISNWVAQDARDRGKALLYWLDGELDLRRNELKELAPNRYQVLGLIRGQGSLRREFVEDRRVDAQAPADGAVARRTFEQVLNNGQPFNDTLRPSMANTGLGIWNPLGWLMGWSPVHGVG